jgi:hypothetical protein
MNHTTKATTLGISAAIVVALAVLMVAATTLATGHNASAAKVKFGSKVEVGDTKTKAIQAADNSQHCGFGAGSTTDTCTNTGPVDTTNTQTQTTNSGSTGGG